MIRVGVIFALSSCGTTRSPVQYRNDTHMLLYTRSTSLDNCYYKALATDANAKGKVTLHVVVEAKTGRLIKPAIDPARSTAPSQLQLCVLAAVDGLRLDPADANEGRATFVYEFRRLEPSS
jgi:hypothetical protein